MKILLLAAFTWLASATSSKRHDAPLNTSLSGQPELVVNASNDFGFQMLRQLSSKGNVFFSPLSISMSMGMVYLGSRNDTEAEMNRILGYERLNLQFENVHFGYKQVMDILKQPGEVKGERKEYDLQMANAMLIDKAYEISYVFKDAGRKFYDAAVESMSFATHPEAAVESVNGWVAWRTKNKIPKILQEPLDPLTRLFLLNAVYFKGTWKTPFDQRLTMPDTFYNDGQVPKTVPMMRQKKKLHYGFVNQIQSHALEIPYSGDDVKMLILLPERRDGLQKMESLLTGELVESVPPSLREATVQVTLPRFNLEEEYDMISLFKALGMTRLFNPATSDLSGISPKRDLYVTKIIHKSVVEVNEEGSEAAAVTGVAAGVRTGGPLIPLFTADHPFVFFIRDTRSNAVLFMGRVNTI